MSAIRLCHFVEQDHGLRHNQFMVLRTLVLLLLMVLWNRVPITSAQNAVPKTFGTAGKELHVLGGGKEAELFRRDGAGCLTHMWFGGDFPGYERTCIRVYVDGEAVASIDMELGLGHGIGFGD